MLRNLVKALYGAFAALLTIALFAPSASAFVLYDGDTKSDPKKSWTWSQNAASWSSSTWLGGFLGESGCMIHSMTEILRKSGTVGDDYTPANFVNDARASGFQWGITANGYGLLSPNLGVPSKGVINSGQQVGSQGGAALGKPTWDDIKNGVKSGKQYIVHVQTSYGPHWVATDYVGSDGTMHMLDSGFDEKQDSSLKTMLAVQGAGGNAGSPSAYTEFSLTKGSWKTMDPKGGGSTSSSTEEKKPAATSDDKDKMVTEDELTGMPDRNDYKAQKQLQLPGNGGYGADGDSSGNSIDSGISKDVATLKEVNTNRINANMDSFGHTLVMLMAILILVYGAVVIPMCFIFDRVNTLFDFSLVGAVTFGRMTTLPKEVSEDEIKVQKGGKKGYLSTKGMILRALLCMFVAAIMLGGLYSKPLLDIFYWWVDFFNNGGVTGNN